MNENKTYHIKSGEIGRYWSAVDINVDDHDVNEITQVGQPSKRNKEVPREKRIKNT